MKIEEWVAGRIGEARRDKTRAAVLSRALYALLRANVRTVEALCALSPAELLRVPGIGPSAVWLLGDLLQADGRSLRQPKR